MPSATSRKSFGSVSPRYTEIMTPPSCVMSCDRARNTALSSSISLRAFAYSARSVSFSAATERAVASDACRSEDARFSASSALRNSSRNREASARSTNTSRLRAHLRLRGRRGGVSRDGLSHDGIANLAFGL